VRSEIPEHFGDFAVFQSGEEAELDDLGFGGVLNRQSVERFIHVKQPLPVMIIGDVYPSEGKPARGRHRGGPVACGGHGR